MINFVALAYIFLAVGIVIIDRITKLYALVHYAVSSYVVNSYLSFELVINRGISWGMFHSPSSITFTIVSCVIALLTMFLAWYAYQHYQRGRAIIGYTCIVAGSISNVIDRFIYGGVVDFILLSYKSYSWPVFNVADTAIVLGVLLVLLIDEQ